jgi:hypothetical protein
VPASDSFLVSQSAEFADLLTNKSDSTVYRYVYGAVFPEFQIFPNAGSPEGTECQSVYFRVQKLFFIV